MTRGVVLEQGFHHIPRQDLAALEAGPDPLRIALRKDPVPALVGVEPAQELVEIGRELPDGVRELPVQHDPPLSPGPPEFPGPL
ncbi:hypothetical protein [Streptomyces sp. KR80]|uniref:hypothetical protein n=1 Tax=Streptomyces sp. KR80 TaxID=3457426 RepID=UPI003FD059B6